jgi:hypothetical protein
MKIELMKNIGQSKSFWELGAACNKTSGKCLK